MITSLAIFNNDSYVPQRWHTSLIMIATIVVPFICNIWFRKVLDLFEISGGILHIVLFLVFIVVLSVFGQRNKPDFVFKTLVYDQSGWSNKGVSWGLGLLSVSFPVVGFDSVLHMCKSPRCALLLFRQKLTQTRRRGQEGSHPCPT